MLSLNKNPSTSYLFRTSLCSQPFLWTIGRSWLLLAPSQRTRWAGALFRPSQAWEALSRWMGRCTTPCLSVPPTTVGCPVACTITWRMNLAGSAGTREERFQLTYQSIFALVQNALEQACSRSWAMLWKHPGEEGSLPWAGKVAGPEGHNQQDWLPASLLQNGVQGRRNHVTEIGDSTATYDPLAWLFPSINYL